MSGEVFSALISNHISILKRKAMQTVVCMAFFIFLNFSKKKIIKPKLFTCTIRYKVIILANIR